MVILSCVTFLPDERYKIRLSISIIETIFLNKITQSHNYMTVIYSVNKKSDMLYMNGNKLNFHNTLQKHSAS
jgi:hypothetical protein